MGCYYFILNQTSQVRAVGNILPSMWENYDFILNQTAHVRVMSNTLPSMWNFIRDLEFESRLNTNKHAYKTKKEEFQWTYRGVIVIRFISRRRVLVSTTKWPTSLNKNLFCCSFQLPWIHQQRWRRRRLSGEHTHFPASTLFLKFTVQLSKLSELYKTEMGILSVSLEKHTK